MRFFLDNNLSPRVARALHCLVEPRHSVAHLKDRFAADITDVEWMSALVDKPEWIILSADIAISRNPHEVEAWKRAGHPIFFFKYAVDNRWIGAGGRVGLGLCSGCAERCV